MCIFVIDCNSKRGGLIVLVFEVDEKEILFEIAHLKHLFIVDIFIVE